MNSNVNYRLYRLAVTPANLVRERLSVGDRAPTGNAFEEYLVAAGLRAFGVPCRSLDFELSRIIVLR